MSDQVRKEHRVLCSGLDAKATKPSSHSCIHGNFKVPHDFGCPGAMLITNFHGKEFYLMEVVVHGFKKGPIFFPANSWIHSRKENPESRIIFKNKAYLPSQTPPGIKDLRREDLLSIRGNGKGERKMHDRIYDYAPYNDLGNPDKGEDLARPVLSGEEMPYPRRCQTGRPPTESEPFSESRIEKPHPVYVPRDETFEEIKQNTFSAGRLKGLLHNLIPAIASALSNEEQNILDNQFLGNLMRQVLTAGQQLLKYEIPAIIKRDRFVWLRDNEFARQTLAGVNPVNIELLREFPIVSKLDPAVYGPPESAITKDLIEQELHMHRMSVEEAIENKRLFILDYHDMLLPFMERMNCLPGRKAYASRTVFSLHPYWLRTHACMEAYIIAAHRQLSSMHPIFMLLHPHMRYTLELNALSRQSLINGGGIIEACFSPGKYSMDISSAAYKSMWRFDMEALPADLIRRGMAVEDPSMPCGVKLVIEDYPYAADGLLIWSAIKELVESYVEHFYPEPSLVTLDLELQAWWNEVKNKGHHDKRNEPWWPKLDTKENLCGILTTMIWIASGQHAAINFGQYPFGGHKSNGDPRHSVDSLSPDEEYLGQVHHLQSHCNSDHQVQIMFGRFSSKLEEVEKTINARNKDIRLRNRTGAGIPPYELLIPLSGPGVTGRGIPNSISI
ncbi:PLAT/LH2 domain-containing lipoxygenase family protein [Actinidia rufa]|uniref:PLAT/LH2 domain-containing lipoxygenase family protein n=1 Tax=Actinidia rufa TaxID=165716 RepID=A0A7J0EYQ5_9ERIC|nr:PLAT/LH2 domain-containing lipoxygenase family protein [Actinidia rufa]